MTPSAGQRSCGASTRGLGQFPLNSAIEPTEDWMKGVNNAKQVYENLMDAKAQQASYDAATKDFKK
jgi:hypothetical protein